MNTAITGLVAQVVITIMSSAGYFGLAGLMAVESACVPLPSEIILPFAGCLISQRKMSLLLVATIGAVGCNIGSAVAYAVGHCGGVSRSSAGGDMFCLPGTTSSAPTASFTGLAAWLCWWRGCSRSFAPSSRCLPGSRACHGCAFTSTPSSVPGHGASCSPMSAWCSGTNGVRIPGRLKCFTTLTTQLPPSWCSWPGISSGRAGTSAGTCKHVNDKATFAAERLRLFLQVVHGAEDGGCRRRTA